MDRARAQIPGGGKGLTLSSRLITPVIKDLELLRELLEPSNEATRSRAGHRMLVRQCPLVLERKS